MILNADLGGGFKYLFNFHPYMGEMIQFDEHIVQQGLKPPEMYAGF